MREQRDDKIVLSRRPAEGRRRPNRKGIVRNLGFCCPFFWTHYRIFTHWTTRIGLPPSPGLSFEVVKSAVQTPHPNGSSTFGSKTKYGPLCTPDKKVFISTRPRGRQPGATRGRAAQDGVILRRLWVRRPLVQAYRPCGPPVGRDQPPHSKADPPARPPLANRRPKRAGAFAGRCMAAHGRAPTIQRAHPCQNTLPNRTRTQAGPQLRRCLRSAQGAKRGGASQLLGIAPDTARPAVIPTDGNAGCPAAQHGQMDHPAGSCTSAGLPGTPQMRA